MKFLKKGSNKGFTIIEVVIVLAIAGLILLLVFQAVPALQRNNRNTQVRNQAATIFSGINDFVTNNQGVMPTTVTATSTDANVTISGAPSTTSITVPNGGFNVSSAATTINATPGNITVRLNTRCNAAKDGFGAATNRAYSAGFSVETSGANIPQCVES
jgi:prepilin-type N-terminal cleavage/methylation domain-containing protein